MKAVVIGAGVAGLSAATFLALGGQDVIVLEAQNRPGGRIVRITRGNDSVEAGAQGVHSNYKEMLGLIEYAGLTDALRPSSGSASYLDRDGVPRISRGNADLMKMMGPRGAVDLAWFRARYFTLAKRFPQFEIARDIPEYDNIRASEAFACGRCIP
ncbi:MAG TPA: FAD-dependent oxidoreductase [Rhizomicrobium sp.]|jgi:phytoene dehydrogenase-like protein